MYIYNCAILLNKQLDLLRFEYRDITNQDERIGNRLFLFIMNHSNSNEARTQKIFREWQENSNNKSTEKSKLIALII